MELNKTYSGFTLNRIEHIDEINGTAYDMKHDKSGARLIYIDAPDTNKFSILPFVLPLRTIRGLPILWNTPYSVGPASSP